MDDILEKLIAERDTLREQFEPMQQRLQRLEVAIRALSGDEDSENSTRKRRKNVRGTVLEIIEQSGEDGASIADILERAEHAGTPLEKTSVSTLVSTLKRSGQIATEGGKFRIVSDGEAQQAEPTKRGRKRSAEASAAE